MRHFTNLRKITNFSDFTKYFEEIVFNNEFNFASSYVKLKKFSVLRFWFSVFLYLCTKFGKL